MNAPLNRIDQRLKEVESAIEELRWETKNAEEAAKTLRAIQKDVMKQFAIETNTLIARAKETLASMEDD